MAKKMSKKLSVSMSMLLYIITVIVNTLSARGFINNSSQKAVSASFPTTITPAGYAFSIWGVIYIMLFASLIILFLRIQREDNFFVVEKLIPLFSLSCVFNIAWTFAFSYRLIWLSVIFIIALLTTVIIMLNKSQKEKPNTLSLFDISLGIYAGWLFVATIVNISAFFVSINFDMLETHKIIYAIIVALAVPLGLFLNKSFRNPFFHFAIIWAFIAIMVATNFASGFMPLFIVLVAGSTVLTIMAIIEIRKVNFKP
ncbi:MAG: hypothetical protein CR988_00920 [Treponema sp.]|nr:MAG: hypothetical protein CR988_00920 [Treponema sp.]